MFSINITLCDSVKFHIDWIFLDLHKGIYIIYKNKLWILNALFFEKINRLFSNRK